MAKIGARTVSMITADTTNYRVPDSNISSGFTTQMDTLVQAKVNSIFNKIESYADNVAKKAFIGSTPARDMPSGSTSFAMYTEQAKSAETLQVLNAQKTSFIPNKPSIGDSGIAFTQQDAIMLSSKRNLHNLDEYRLLQQEVGALGGRVDKRKTSKGYEAMIEMPMSMTDYSQTANMKAKEAQKYLENYIKGQTPLTNAEYKRTSGMISAETRQRNKEKAEKEAEKAHNEEIKDKKASRKKTLAILGVVVSVLGTIADITRRILTASLARASEARKEAIEARTVGMTYIASRELNTKDVGHGLAQGTTMGAIQDIQAKFGDITKLDEQALQTLARVMGGGVQSMVTSGMGGTQPDVLLSNILNKFFENFKQGKNSLGQMVGQEQAKRELTTVLREVSPQIASIFSTMANDYSQGIYAGKFRTYEEYQGLVKDYKMGLTEGEFQKFTELGAVVDQLKAKFMNLKDDILVKFGNAISDLVVKANNTEFGMSGKEKVETRAEKLLANKADAEKARMGMKVADVGVKSELAKYGLTLEQFGASSGAELWEGLASIDEDTTENEYQARLAKYSELINIFSKGEGKELKEAMKTAKAYSDAEKITSARASTKSGKVDYDATLVTEAGIRVAIMELDNQFHTAFAQNYNVSMAKAFEEYQKTYGAFNATEYKTNDNLIKALTSIANRKLKQAGREQLSTKWLGGLKDEKDLTTLNNLISEGFLTSEDLVSAFSQAGGGFGFNYAETASTMQASLADKAKESQDEYAKVTDAVREFVTQNYANLEKAYTSGYTVDKAVSVYGTKGTNELNVTLNLVDPQGKKQTLRTTIHTDMNESINVQRNLEMSVTQ